MRSTLAANWDKEVRMVVERTSGDKSDPTTERIETLIPVNPQLELGIVMGFGPIVAIQNNSPAALAGLQIGDQLLEVDGKPIGDPMTLAHRMTIAAREKKSVPFLISRESKGVSSEELTISVSPRMPRSASNSSIRSVYAINPLGIAVTISKEIESIVPGGPADGLGLKPGDTLTKAKIQLTDELKEHEEIAPMEKEVDFTEEISDWPSFLSMVQNVRPPCPIDFEFTRDGEVVKATLTPVELDTYFRELRGIRPTEFQKTYEASSLMESIQLGFSQTYRDMTRIGVFLKKLVTGRVSPTLLGGPATIAAAATSEASQGTSRLLLFLTLLSANLAIVNFLPIPVLDGGHMVFLAYEGIFRRPVSEKAQIILSFAGLIFIVGLMLFVIGLDILRFT